MPWLDATEWPFQAPFAVAVAVAAWSAVAAFRRRPAPGSTPGAILMSALALWAAAYGLELGCEDPALRDRWVRLEYLGICVVPVAFVSLAGSQLGLARRAGRWSLPLLGVVPAVTLALVWTGNPGRVMWASREFELLGPISLVRSTYGPWFWVHYFYGTGLVVVGAVLLVAAALHSARLYRLQLAWLLGGLSVPWVVNLLYVLRLEPFATIDFTSAAFTVSGALVVRALRRHALFDLVPVARERIFEAIGDGVLVLDAERRIVDANHAAAALLGGAARDLPGRPAAEVLPPELAELLRAGATVWTREVESAPDGGAVLEVRSQPLANVGGAPGQLLLLADRTAHKRAEQRLRFLSTHDSLTGVLNRACFEDLLDRLRSEGPYPVTFVVADVDDLKNVNDQAGHAAGDALLRRTADALRGSFRAGDQLFRIGGDEFAVVLPEVGDEGAGDLVAGAEAALGRIVATDSGHALSLSIGRGTARDGTEIDSALRQADDEMYRRKRSGRRRWVERT